MADDLSLLAPLAPERPSSSSSVEDEDPGKRQRVTPVTRQPLLGTTRVDMYAMPQLCRAYVRGTAPPAYRTCSGRGHSLRASCAARHTRAPGPLAPQAPRWRTPSLYYAIAGRRRRRRRRRRQTVASRWPSCSDTMCSPGWRGAPRSSRAPSTYWLPRCAPTRMTRPCRHAPASGECPSPNPSPQPQFQPQSQPPP